MSEYLEALFGLRGKIALVTGASRGIGAAVAEALSLAGATTIGVGRSNEPQTVLQAPSEYRVCDVTDEARFAETCAYIERKYERLDILVNAAGISIPSQEVNASDAFDRTIATNLTAVFRCCLEAVKVMARSRGGSIVNVTSIGSVLGFPDNPGYVASKGGVRALTKSLAIDLAGHGIRVNTLAPGYIRTRMTEKSFLDPMLHEARLNRMMIRRWGAPGDIAGAAIYLASNASSYVTGAELFVDGGWTAKGI